MRFFDTCALLNSFQEIQEPILISSITLRELEGIKTSGTKDEETRFKARKVIHWLDDHPSLYEVVQYLSSWDKKLKRFPSLSDNNDSRILLSVLIVSKEKEVIFITDDLCCKMLAKSIGLTVEYSAQKVDTYTGFKIINPTTEELANIYTTGFCDSIYDLVENEYLLIQQGDKIVDSFKYVGGRLVRIKWQKLESKMFGAVAAADIYQAIAIDSLLENKITVLRGSAGSGKSYLALSFLFNQLERGKISKILIFCNTVATAGSAKLGFYPGTREEKLLDSQIGNFLVSKIGDRVEVEELLKKGIIELIPMSDIRGYDTTGMNAGIYITEAQNMNIDLMKLALQRIGEDSICILDGDDLAQVDMPMYSGRNNGLRRVSEIFRGDELYGEVTLQKIRRSHIAELAQQL